MKDKCLCEGTISVFHLCTWDINQVEFFISETRALLCITPLKSTEFYTSFLLNHVLGKWMCFSLSVSSKLSVVIELATLSLILGMLTMINKEIIRLNVSFGSCFGFLAFGILGMCTDQNPGGSVNIVVQKLICILRLLFSFVNITWLPVISGCYDFV